MKRWGRRLAIVVGGVLTVLALSTLIAVGLVETQCRSAGPVQQSSYRSLLAPEARRNVVNTYLTYPEWSIVHAYEDLAGVMRTGSESDFDYAGHTANFWSSLCRVKRKAAGIGPVSFDYNSMLYTIGISFTAEMLVQGLYEKTVGRLTAWVQGSAKTPEDVFASGVAEEYAKFLHQVPWYEFPFGATLGRFWRETPLWGGNVIRKIERRLALTLEYGVKSLYARGIKMLAGLSPAELTIRSVVSVGAPCVIDGEAGVAVIARPDPNTAIIETARYASFTEIIKQLAAKQCNFVEIAGNRNIFVAIRMKPGSALPTSAGAALLEVPIQARPGWVRSGRDVKVVDLMALVRDLRESNVELEHIYDY